MPVSADTLRLHLDYTAWATRRLLHSVANLTAEDLARDFNTSDKTVLNTLAHVFAADRVWLGRIQGNPPANFIAPEDRQLSVLQKEWPALQERWKQWATPLTHQDAQAQIA